jgi:hypothetical protein
MSCLIAAQRVANAWQTVEDRQQDQNVVSAFLYPAYRRHEKIDHCSNCFHGSCYDEMVRALCRVFLNFTKSSF